MWTQRYRTILSLATKPLRRNVRSRAMKRAAVVSSSTSWVRVSWATHRDARPPQTGEARTFVQIEDICADELDDPIRLGDALFHDDDAAEQVDKGVFEAAFASEFDAASAMDGLCERGGVDVELVERDDVLLVVRGRGLDLVNDFWEGVRDRRWHGWVQDAVVTCHQRACRADDVTVEHALAGLRVSHARLRWEVAYLSLGRRSKRGRDRAICI
jgi:hypothetical protein